MARWEARLVAISEARSEVKVREEKRRVNVRKRE